MNISDLTPAPAEAAALITDLFYRSRRDLLIHHPFSGSMAMHMELLVTRDEKMQTSCTDGSTLCLNADFFAGLTDELRMLVIAHNVWHCALLHRTRRSGYPQQVYDYACDLEVDMLLYKDGFNFPMLPCNTAWQGLSVEQICGLLPAYIKREIYWDVHLYEELPIPGSKKISGNSDDDSFPEPQNSEENKEDSPDSGTAQDSGSENKEETEKAPEGTAGKGKSKKQTKSVAGTKGKKRSDSENTLGSGNASKGKSSQKTSSEASASEGESDGEDVSGGQLAAGAFPVQKWAEIVNSSMESALRRGTVPAHISQSLQLHEKKTLSWQELLRDYLTRHIRGSRCWTHPNRRHIHRKLYLPGVTREPSVEITIALDTSGSTSGFLSDFLAELHAIFSEFSDYEVVVIQCETEINSVETYSTASGELFPDGRSSSFVMTGGGGTDLQPPFEYVANELSSAPQCFLYFTDGFGPAPGTAPDYPVIWVLTPNGVKPADWGEAVYINNGDQK